MSASQWWQPVPGYKFLVNGTQLPHVKSYHVDKNKWEPTKIGVTFDDADRLYAPFNSYSPYFNLLKPNVWASGVVSRVAQLQLALGGEVWRSPDEILLEYSYKADERGYEVGSTGIDFQHILMRENQSMQPWRSTPSNVVTSYQIIGQILSTYGIPYRLEHDDYPVREFHFQAEKPIDAIKRLLYVACASWHIDENRTFHTYQPSNTTPSWTFRAGVNMKVLDYKYSCLPIINSIEVRRSLSANKLVAEDEKTGDAGFKILKWSTPKVNLRVVTELRSGSISNPLFPAEFYGPSGIVSASGPATEYHFTFVPSAGYVVGAPGDSGIGVIAQTYWHIWVYGDDIMPDVFGPFDESFSVTVINQNSVAVDGPWPAKEPEENQLIPNIAVAKTLGEHRIEEGLRLRETLAVSTIGNPWIEVDDVCEVAEGHGAITGLWRVEHARTSGHQDGAETQVELSRIYV